MLRPEHELAIPVNDQFKTILTLGTLLQVKVRFPNFYIRCNHINIKSIKLQS
jgi:hypothetical protein